MPVMMSCENFGAIQFPDKAGFDNTRASHIWKINVSADEKASIRPKASPGISRAPGVSPRRMAGPIST